MRSFFLRILPLALIVALVPSAGVAHAGVALPSANPAVAASTPGLLFGWVHLGPGLPVENAMVTLRTRSGDVLGESTMTGLGGEFALSTVGMNRPRLAILEARGGTVEGRPWRGTLRAVITRSAHPHMAHVNVVTTMATTWQLAKPGRSRLASINRVRTVLGLDRHHDIESDLRLGTTPLSGTKILSAIERRGWKRWLRSHVRLMDSRQPAPGCAWRDCDYPGIQRSAGGTAAGLVWNAVLAAAQSCNPSNSSIPGVGYLASALADTGLVSQDPSCSELKEILNDLEQIEQGITQIETALQTASNEIFAVAALIKVDALSNARSQLQYNVLSPITVGQASYTFLINSAQTTVARTGLPLGTILTSEDDTVLSDPNVKQLRTNAASVLSPAGPLGTAFATAVTSFTAPSTVTDTMGGIDKGVLHLTWEAVRTLSPFIDAQQLALYNQVVDYLRQINAHAAALSIDIARSTNLTSEQITNSVIGRWQLPDSYFDSVSTDFLPCPSPDETLDGRCEPLTVSDATGTAVAWAHAAPVLDPDSGLLWSAVCTETGMALDACEATGIMSFTRGDGRVTPYWFDTPVRMTWGDDGGDGGAFTRPTSTQIKTLAEVAAANGQQSSAVTGWIAKQAPVFGTVASAPIASNVIGFDCGWAIDDDYAVYFVCPATEICTDGFTDPFGPYLGPGSCFGLQGAGYKVAIDLLDTSHRIGWAVPTSATTLPLVDQPGPPPNYFESQAVVWEDGLGCGYEESKPPPSTPGRNPWCSYEMSSRTAPLAVRTADVTRYQVASWVLTN